MDNIPRQRNFACLSLKNGSILTALFFMLFSVLYLARCIAALCELASQTNVDNAEYGLGVVYLPIPHRYHSYGIMMGIVIALTISHSMTLFLAALMLVGVLREKLHLICPWVVWTRIQLMIYVMLTVRWTVANFTNLSDGNTLLMVAVVVLRLFLRFNLLMIVASYYKQLKEEQFDGERVKNLVQQDTQCSSA